MELAIKPPTPWPNWQAPVSTRDLADHHGARGGGWLINYHFIIRLGSAGGTLPPSTVRPLARGPRVLIGWPLPLGFGLGGCLLLARTAWAGLCLIHHHQAWQCGQKAPAVENFAWLPVGAVSTETGRGSVSLI